MIDLLYRRKIVREVLNNFSSKNWNILVPLLVEIGIIFIKKNFNITEMSLDDLKQVLCT